MLISFQNKIQYLLKEDDIIQTTYINPLATATI